jgi:hypothetical protein
VLPSVGQRSGEYGDRHEYLLWRRTTVIAVLVPGVAEPLVSRQNHMAALEYARPYEIEFILAGWCRGNRRTPTFAAAGRGRSQHGTVDVRNVAVVGGHDDDSVRFGRGVEQPCKWPHRVEIPPNAYLVAPIEVVVDCVDNGTHDALVGVGDRGTHMLRKSAAVGSDELGLVKKHGWAVDRGPAPQCRMCLEAGAFLGLTAFDPLPGEQRCSAYLGDGRQHGDAGRPGG